MRIETNPNTMWKAEWESDPRDFLVENILGTPTEQDLKDLPKSINLLSELPRTYDQRNVGACTAFGLTHVQLLQNVKDFETNLVELDPWSLWRNMGHNPDDARDGGDYLENALKFSKSKGINGTKPDGKPHVFLTEGYAYGQFGDLQTKDFDTIKYYLSKGMPVYTAMKGNSKTWREMVAGEVTTLFTVGESTGGHAISIFGIDDEYLYFANSWAPVNGEKLSSFKIRRDKFATLKRNSVVNRRYWIVYDKKDITTPPLFDDYYKDKDTEEYKAVKMMKDLGLIKGANGKLMPNEPLTREQMCLIFYRFINILTKILPQSSEESYTVEQANKDMKQDIGIDPLQYGINKKIYTIGEQAERGHYMQLGEDGLLYKTNTTATSESIAKIQPTVKSKSERTRKKTK